MKYYNLHYVLLVLCLSVLGGCSLMPKSLQGEYKNVTIDEAKQHNAEHAVRWGGAIVRVENKDNKSVIEIVSTPLGLSGRPQDLEESTGRFLAVVEGFIDPLIYKKGREITVVGLTSGVIDGKIGEMSYPFAVISVTSYHLWRERPYYPNYYYHYRHHSYPSYWHYGFFYSPSYCYYHPYYNRYFYHNLGERHHYHYSGIRYSARYDRKRLPAKTFTPAFNPLRASEETKRIKSAAGGAALRGVSTRRSIAPQVSGKGRKSLKNKDSGTSRYFRKSTRGSVKSYRSSAKPGAGRSGRGYSRK